MNCFEGGRVPKSRLNPKNCLKLASMPDAWSARHRNIVQFREVNPLDSPQGHDAETFLPYRYPAADCRKHCGVHLSDHSFSACGRNFYQRLRVRTAKGPVGAGG